MHLIKVHVHVCIDIKVLSIMYVIRVHMQSGYL